jgi:glutathione peroxidase
MKTVLFLSLLAMLASSVHAQDDHGVYSFTMTTIDGEEKALGDFEGEVLLLVNTASKCGFTPQYASLEKLYRKYKDDGLRILAFPANNFGGQEPGTDEQIQEFCSTTYDVTFDMFSKISVAGEDMHPLYVYLTQQSGFGDEIQWNFTKFLVDRTGKVLARFNTKVDPLDQQVIEAVEKALGE